MFTRSKGTKYATREAIPKKIVCVVAFSSAPWPKYAIKTALIVFGLCILGQKGLITQLGKHFQSLLFVWLPFHLLLGRNTQSTETFFEHFLAALVSDFFDSPT